MYRRVVAVMFLGMLWSLAGARPSQAQDRLTPLLKAQWESTRDLVTGIVSQVPENLYDFKPTPEVRTFREQFTHLVTENYTFMARAAGEAPPVDVSALGQLKGREEILKALKESYDYGAKVWAGMNDQKLAEMVPGRGGQQQARLTAILGNITDNMDHYGNLVVYVRLNGMVPGRTAARQQQQPQR
ncbi:MAG TPA: DinB family protein [Terriglobia bacterium]|nr:DinB family protein [Terriglobia bacterium]